MFLSISLINKEENWQGQQSADEIMLEWGSGEALSLDRITCQLIGSFHLLSESQAISQLFGQLLDQAQCLSFGVAASHLTSATPVRGDFPNATPGGMSLSSVVPYKTGNTVQSKYLSERGVIDGVRIKTTERN